MSRGGKEHIASKLIADWSSFSIGLVALILPNRRNNNWPIWAQKPMFIEMTRAWILYALMYWIFLDMFFLSVIKANMVRAVQLSLTALKLHHFAVLCHLYLCFTCPLSIAWILMWPQKDFKTFVFRELTNYVNSPDDGFFLLLNANFQWMVIIVDNGDVLPIHNLMNESSKTVLAFF